MRELLIATTNKGKLSEILPALEELNLRLVTLSDVGIKASVEEPAMTYEGNAIIKAMTYGEASGKLTLAEDAGLEVDALNGVPGVLSARYAPGTDDDRNRKLLKALETTPDEKRTARFRVVIAVFDPTTKKIRTCEGVCEGKILHEGRGMLGFGYCPLFRVDENGLTLGEMDVAVRSTVDHRGKALSKAKEILLGEFA